MAYGQFFEALFEMTDLWCINSRSIMYPFIHSLMRLPMRPSTPRMASLPAFTESHCLHRCKTVSEKEYVTFLLSLLETVATGGTDPLKVSCVPSHVCTYTYTHATHKQVEWKEDKRITHAVFRKVFAGLLFLFAI